MQGHSLKVKSLLHWKNNETKHQISSFAKQPRRLLAPGEPRQEIKLKFLELKP